MSVLNALVIPLFLGQGVLVQSALVASSDAAAAVESTYVAYNETVDGTDFVPYNETVEDEVFVPYNARKLNDRRLQLTADLGCGSQVDIKTSNHPKYLTKNAREEWEFTLAAGVKFVLNCVDFDMPRPWNSVRLTMTAAGSTVSQLTDDSADPGPETKDYAMGPVGSVSTVLFEAIGVDSWKLAQRGTGFKCTAKGVCDGSSPPPPPPTSTTAAPPATTAAPPATTAAPPATTAAPSSPSLTCGVCGNNRIIDGTTSTDNTYCFQVRVVTGGAGCGGTLIAPDTVLTAAHCVDSGASSSVYYDCDSGQCAGVRSSSSVVWHTGWDPSGAGLCSEGNDIAIVKLSSPVPISSTVNFACLPKDCLSRTGQEATILGYGRTCGSCSGSNQLKIAKMVTTTENCSTCASNVLCATDVTGRTCNGDSGGFFGTQVNGRWVVDGVTSFGPQGCTDSGTEGFAQVCSFRDNFIADNAGTGTQTIN